jgi:hypothetical protein
MAKARRVYGIIFIMLCLLLGWALFFHYFPIERLIDLIGIRNLYLAAFVLSVVGGFSFVTGTSLYAALIALSHGGVNPYILGTIAGVGIFLSDSLFYLVMLKARSYLLHVTEGSSHITNRLWKWIYSVPPWMVYFGIYLYAAFMPIPNDLLLAVLALSGYRYREFLPFLLLGDLTMTLLLTTVSSVQ